MEFDLWRNLTPAGSIVDVQKLGTAADIVVRGDILNPAGWTRLLNDEGDIRSVGIAWIETWVAEIEATEGSIGTVGRPRRGATRQVGQPRRSPRRGR